MDLKVTKDFLESDEFEKYLIEELAELEHIKWMEWARHLLSEEPISTQRVQRWAKLFVPYKELSESEKEKDRVLARRVYKSLKEKIEKFIKIEHGVYE